MVGGAVVDCYPSFVVAAVVVIAVAVVDCCCYGVIDVGVAALVVDTNN